MARYTGPKRKIERRFGELIFSSKPMDRKKYTPGQHGSAYRRRKRSEYSIQLAEKQKAKYTYGILERQFIKMFREVSKKKGITGELLLQLCESRLDNVVYRLKLAPSRPAARQLVSHRHIIVNGGIVNIPSYTLKPGDVIGVREKSKNHKAIQKALNTKIGTPKDWLIWNSDQMNGTFQALPERLQIPENIKEQLIVELYSK
ncbi:MAG: 30S ribosomal protein S4 [Flavobacteriales bacterium AspAUS03]